MSAELTVVIPTHGKRILLERTLAALLAQDLAPARWNAVVVDDASPDDTGAWLREQAHRWGGRLRTVSPARNVGRARARNLGAAEADGRWILFLDDDIVAPPSLLSAHLDLLGGGGEVGTIGVVQTEPDLVDAPHFHYIDSRGVAKVGGDRVPPKYLVTQNTAVPREAFLAAGGFDEAFTGYGFEDMDLGFRLEAQGVVFRPLRSPVPIHVHHHTFAEWIDKKRACGHGSLQRLAETQPERLPEMRLHWVLDRPGHRSGKAVRCLRLLGRTAVRPVLRSLLPLWPAGARHRPRWEPLYALALDALIMTTYCQGVAENGRAPARRD